MTQDNSKEIGNANFELSAINGDQEVDTFGKEEMSGPINVE